VNHLSRIETIAEGVTLYLGDCREILPTLGNVDAVVTDPPYGMGKGTWDESIPEWLPLVGDTPTVCFCGVVGMRDYHTPDWTGAWVRLGSTQRNGALKGFNNWEPLLFYNVDKLDNDVIAEPNYHEVTGHPTTKPTRLMERLIEKMPAGVVLDPFMGSGTTGVAAVKLGRKFIGIEIEPKYFDIACKRIADALKQPDMFIEAPKPAKQESLL
jgi:DNA modification methylase